MIYHRTKKVGARLEQKMEKENPDSPKMIRIL
jgi:hypothetical protein